MTGPWSPERAPLPEPDAASAPFWEATRERRLVLPWCVACERPVWYPKEVCHGCLGSAIEWRPASGRGTVCTFLVEHRPAPAFGPDPYVVALVDLDEGVRFMTNVVGCPTSDVTVGQAVVVTWEPQADGRHLPLFTPATP